MKTGDRDPRVDPKPGDVVRIEPWNTRFRVVQVGDLIVVVTPDHPEHEMLTTPDQWRDLAPMMEVISRAE